MLYNELFKMKIYWNKLNKFLQATLITLPIWLLFRLFSQEEFTRVDYILMIVLSFAGILGFATKAFRRNNEQKPSDQG
jgi:hypothetical protein